MGSKDGCEKGTRKEMVLRRERAGSIGTLEDWCKRKREGQDGNGEEKGEENWMFKKSKKVMRSPVNKG